MIWLQFPPPYRGWTSIPSGKAFLLRSWLQNLSWPSIRWKASFLWLYADLLPQVLHKLSKPGAWSWHPTDGWPDHSLRHRPCRGSGSSPFLPSTCGRTASGAWIMQPSRVDWHIPCRIPNLPCWCPWFGWTPDYRQLLSRLSLRFPPPVSRVGRNSWRSKTVRPRSRQRLPAW